MNSTVLGLIALAAGVPPPGGAPVGEDGEEEEAPPPRLCALPLPREDLKWRRRSTCVIRSKLRALAPKFCFYLCLLKTPTSPELDVAPVGVAAVAAGATGGVVVAEEVEVATAAEEDAAEICSKPPPPPPSLLLAEDLCREKSEDGRRPRPRLKLLLGVRERGESPR